MISNYAFVQELYQEHLEEGSFLYEQRNRLTTQPDIFWEDIEDEEVRLEKHLKALAGGGDMALSVCLERYRDAGDVHILSRLL